MICNRHIAKYNSSTNELDLLESELGSDTVPGAQCIADDLDVVIVRVIIDLGIDSAPCEGFTDH